MAEIYYVNTEFIFGIKIPAFQQALTIFNTDGNLEEW